MGDTGVAAAVFLSGKPGQLGKISIRDALSRVGLPQPISRRATRSSTLGKRILDGPDAGRQWRSLLIRLVIRHHADVAKACRNNPRFRAQYSFDPSLPQIKIRCKTIKRRSHLCTPNRCHRDHPAACHAVAVNTSTLVRAIFDESYKGGHYERGEDG